MHSGTSEGAAISKSMLHDKDLGIRKAVTMDNIHIEIVCGFFLAQSGMHFIQEKYDVE